MFRYSLKPHLLTSSSAVRSRPFKATGLRAIHIATQPPEVEYKVRIPTTDLDQFGGYFEVKNNLADIVRYLQAPETFEKAGIKPPKGILLSGPPGVGKTMLAEAVAGHSGVPFIIISASEILDKWVGGAEEKLKNLFNTAAKNAPCVLVIDELDSIAGKRFSSPETSNERHDNAIVNQLLPLLSTIIPGVVVIATTNLPESLDPAVTRSGRFDRHIVMDMPDKTDRLQILRLCLNNKKLDAATRLEDLAAISSGFSGATLSAWVNEASMFALKEKSRAITLKHFDKARSVIQHGCLGRRHSNEEALKVAQHEIGHALVAHLLGLTIYKVSVLKMGYARGFMELIPKESNSSQTKQELENLICICLAGRAAELVFGSAKTGSSYDLHEAKRLINHLVFNEGMGKTLSGIGVNEEIETILQEQMARAGRLLHEKPVIFHKLVAALVHEGELYSDDFLNVLEGTYSPSAVSSSNSDTAEQSRLPMKKSQMTRISSSQKENVAKVSFFNNKSKSELSPFTIDEIAIAIGVEAKLISSAEFAHRHSRRYLIRFNLGFNQHEYITNDLEKLLYSNNVVESDYNVETRTLEIGSEDIDDFISFVNYANKPGVSP